MSNGTLRAGPIALALLLAAAGRASEPPPAAAAAPFRLADPRGRERAVAFPRERVCVLVVADRRGAEQLEPWLRSLAGRYGERVDLLGVATLRGVPGPFRGVVRGFFRRQGLDGVLLDWTGDVSAGLAAEPGVANVIVAARDGAIRHRASGIAGPEALAECFARIDGLLAPPGG